MSKTNELKKVVETQLKTVATNVFHNLAQKEVYPRVIFSFKNADLGDMNRDDIILTIDVWDKGPSTVRVDEISDDIESLLNGANLPQESILPTFYRIDRQTIYDEDKTISRRQLRFQIQNYERS